MRYCHLPALSILAPFQIDHIIARQHGGSSDLDNLALCCIHCNRFKGPNIAGVDSNTGEVVRFFIRDGMSGRNIFNGAKVNCTL